MPLFNVNPSLTRGSGTLTTGGIVNITDSAALPTSMIVLTNTQANTTSEGSLSIQSKSTGSFVVGSTNILDRSPFDYVIMN